MKLIDMDELAAFIREVNGDNKMGAGVLAENICDWIASKQPRYATADNQVPDEAFEDEFQAWWESDGQYCRSGTSGYEVPFAFQAWRHLVPTIMEVRAENEKLRGLMPDFPPRPPDGQGLPRYGLRWNGEKQPLSVPMSDGYWTPWHLADSERERAESYLATFVVLADFLNIDLKAASKAPGKPSDVFIEAIKKKAGDL